MIAKRTLEDFLIFPFIILGRLVALFKPVRNYEVYYFFSFYHIGGAEKVHAQITNAVGGPKCIIFFTRKSHNDHLLPMFKQSGCVIRDISAFTDNKFLYFLNLIYRGILSGYINRQKNRPVVFNGQCNMGYKIAPWVKKEVRQLELIHSFNSFSYIRVPFLPFIRETIMISRKRIADHLGFYQSISIPAGFAERIHYISNAVTLPATLAEKPPSQFTVLYVGRGGVEKRVPLIMKIASALYQADSTIAIEMLGDVSDVVNPADYPFATFHGNQQNPDFINAVYARANVLILASTTEGFPLVVIEAMAHGCAIIATPVGDIPAHVHEENGFLFSSVEDESVIFAEAVDQIRIWKADLDLLHTIATINIQYTRDNFDIRNFNDTYRKLLKKEIT